MTPERMLALTLAACAFLQSSAAAQANRPLNPYESSTGVPLNGGHARDAMNQDDDESMKFMERRMLEARKLDRKKRMVDTANRLLVLTKQLQNDLKGREAGPEDEKRLDEIARLARQVKDQMRQ